MPNLTLNELLRYGFAGAMFFLVGAVAFEEPWKWFSSNEDIAGAIATLAVAAGLTVGATVYAIHRAVIYPVLYGTFARLTKRGKTTLELDILRWQHAAKKDALQPRMADWAAQVHFLYCLAWSSVAALGLGGQWQWMKQPVYSGLVWLCAALALCAMVHHFRHLLWEKRVFELDAANSEPVQPVSPQPKPVASTVANPEQSTVHT